jgi:Concanavalin A-like lectin/glucanases superfamily
MRSMLRVAHVPLGAAAVTLLLCAGTSQAASSMRAEWMMDETSGTQMFDSVGSHTGTLHDVTVGQPGWTGTAYGFNGSSSYVTVPSASDLNPGAADVSFTMHLLAPHKPAAKHDYDLFRKGVDATNGGMYKAEMGADGRITCRFKGSHDIRLHTGPAIADDKWHTVTCSKTSSTISLTVDGKTWATSRSAGSISNSADVVLGAKPGDDWYAGLMDDVSISIG